MTKIFISVFTILLVAGGCSSLKNTVQKRNMQIISAEYEKWTKPPVQNSSVPERGTNLYLTVQHWPQNGSPVYIVFRGNKSFKPVTINSNGNHTTMKARTIELSSVLVDKRNEPAVSDRLVYVTAEGDTAFIEIKKWRERN